MKEIDKHIDKIADKRHNLHVSHSSSRPLSEGYEKIGLCGEFAFGVFCGLMPDISEKPKGDKGIDFCLNLKFSIDVKTALVLFPIPILTILRQTENFDLVCNKLLWQDNTTI